MSMSIYDRACARIYDANWLRLSGGDVSELLLAMVEQHNAGAKRWVDLCCGGGRLLETAVEHGFEVTGVDVSDAQLALARRRVPDAEFIRSDVMNVQLSGGFDVVTCLGGSVNYFTDDSDVAALFERVRGWMAAGGLLMFDVNTPLGYEVNAFEPSGFVGDDYGAVVSIEYDNATKLANWQMTGFVREDDGFYQRVEECHELRGYEENEINRMLADAGLIGSCRDADSLEEPDEETARLIYCCQCEDVEGKK